MKWLLRLSCWLFGGHSYLPVRELAKTDGGLWYSKWRLECLCGHKTPGWDLHRLQLRSERRKSELRLVKDARRGAA